jgi:hypothetical protein
MQKDIPHVLMTQCKTKHGITDQKPRHYILCEHGTFTGVSKCAIVTKIKYVYSNYWHLTLRTQNLKHSTIEHET